MISSLRRLWIFALMAAGCVTQSSYGADFSLSVLSGYKGGLGFGASAQVADFAAGFPLAFQLTLNHVRTSPGSPEKARKIFINDATDGTPEKSGYAWEAQMDFLYRVRFLGTRDAFFYAGVRRSMFTANFKFVGGNEFFDIQTDQWGVDAGLQASFPMANRVGLVVRIGVEHHFAATLYGHDTSYGPDGETISGRNDYTYEDADAAVNQPKFNVVGMLGISFGL